MLSLKDKSLFREAGLIGGAWTLAQLGAVVPVTDPATDQVIGMVPDMGMAETAAAIAAASETFAGWKAKTNSQWTALLEKWHALMLEHQEDLALILTAEQGKPLSEARGEIAYSASFVKWFAEEARRIGGRTIPAPTADRRILVLKEPVGVCGIITPWSFPSTMITRKVAPALVAGCTVVIKPSEFTPFSALALGVLAERAGIPAGVVNIVTDVPTEIGHKMTANAVVRKISFTGSTRIGALLMRESAATIKRLSLERGGDAPFIVFDDADVEAAIASKFRNGGQTCVCSNRLLVQSGIYDAFATRLAARVSAMRVGAGTEAGVDVGPMINQAACTKISRHVADALARGATLLSTRPDLPAGGNFVAPMVLGDATTDMQLAREEIFGPVISLFRFKTEEEATGIANATPFGPAAYFYTTDMKRFWRVAEALESGMVGLNTGMVSMKVAPFGGIKQSGLGREGVQCGIEEYLEMRSFHIGGLS